MEESDYKLKSGMGWVDFSPSQRDSFQEIMRALQSPGTVDELGIGVIRNAFSDEFFPGISTIMTRAKYYLLVPYILKDYLLYEINNQTNAKSYLRAEENKIIENLSIQYYTALDNDDMDSERRSQLTSGILGSETYRQGKELGRKPSTIYWGGLKKWRIINTNLSLSNFLAEIDNRKRELLTYTADSLDVEEGVEHPYVGNIINIAGLGKDWKDNLSIILNQEEADFLRGNIKQYVGNSLLGQLMITQKKPVVDAFINSKNFKYFVKAVNEKLLPKDLYQDMLRAVAFWEVMEGAHILYNILLFEKYASSSNCPFIDSWEEWSERMVTNSDYFELLSTGHLWQIAGKTGHRVDNATRQFIDEWITWGDSGKQYDYRLEKLQNLVVSQERHKKGGRSKLLSQKDPDFAAQYQGKRIGIDEVNYRYPTARQIIKDIYFSLEK